MLPEKQFMLLMEQLETTFRFNCLVTIIMALLVIVVLYQRPK